MRFVNSVPAPPRPIPANSPDAAWSIDKLGISGACERKAAQLFQLGDLGQQALQADPARISRQERKSGSLAGIDQQCIQPLAHARVQAIGYAP